MAHAGDVDPRAAMSVATSTGVWPWRKRLSAAGALALALIAMDRGGVDAGR